MTARPEKIKVKKVCMTTDAVPVIYQQGTSSRKRVQSRKSKRASLQERLTEKREELLSQVDWNRWDPELSRKLELLDHLLSI